MQIFGIFKTLGLITLLVFTTACSRFFEDETKSKLVIKAPTQQQLQGKVVGSMSAFPVGYDYCFGVNITAPDLISAPANTCSPEQGLFQGYVPAGGNIEILAPRGAARDIKVYLHLQPLGTGCRASAGLNNGELNEVYLIGQANGINFDAPEITVEINASFPGLANHVASSIGAPPTCLDDGTAPSGPRNGEVLAGGGNVPGSTDFSIKNSNIGSSISKSGVDGTTHFKIKGL
tara:strand:+ start:4312 stop:5010 length:699 start_codon:yes stop_codon:yes gene_type:complete